MAQGRKADILPYGNGCKLHPDCFTCPIPDCVWLYGMNKAKQESLIKLEKPFFERINRVETLGGKG